MEQPNTGYWISTEAELPPEDGVYLCTNHLESFYDRGFCFYDGYGFSVQGIYRNVKYWGFQDKREKRYGIIEE